MIAKAGSHAGAAGPQCSSSVSATCSISQDANVEMGKPVAVVLYVLALVAVVVSVDVLFFRHHLGSGW
jgi:hypothetical protein